MLSEELKEATKINHQLLEKKLIVRIKSIRNKHDYAELLVLFYSFFGGLEVNINNHLDLCCLPDYPHRRKTTDLANDLIRLGAGLPALANGNALPEIKNHFQALGVLYVMEGSTLGGKIISKMIRQQLNFPDMDGMSFFNGYGNQTERMWQTFKQSIDQPLKSFEKGIVIQSANNTFIQFRHWLEHSRL